MGKTLNISVNELLLGEKINENNLFDKSKESIAATIDYSQKAIKKKTKKIYLKIIISIIIIFLVSFFGYKIYLLNKYNINKIPEAKQVIKNFTNYQIINIKNKALNNDEYFVLDNIKMKNDFLNFTEVNLNNIDPFCIKKWQFKETNSNNAFIISISAYPFQTLFDANSDLIIFSDANLPKIDNKERIAYLYSNNITNEMAFFKFLSDKKNFQNNIFSSPKNIRGSYAALLSATIFANYQISFLKGNYEGYLFYDKENNISEFHILKNNLSYNFTFIGSNFTLDYIKELLNTLVIN